MNFSRRQFVVGSLVLPAFAAKKPAGETPNIVLILAENVPAWMLGCYGNKEVQTPSIDRLAQTGTRFLNHIAGAGLPAAARTALLTGSPAGTGASLDKLLGPSGYTAQAAAGSTDAVKIIDAQAPAKPFLLTVTLSDFTPPYPAASKYLDAYAAAKFDTFEQAPPARNIAADQGMFGTNLLPSLRKAAAAITAIDAEVGAITAKLSQKKLLDNTLVIFTAPTGSLIGRHGLWSGSAASDPHNFFEEVIATPMIWTWPSRVPPLSTRPEVVSAFDLVPTLCDLTPAELPAGNLPGRSYLLPLQGKPLPKKEPWRSLAFLSTPQGAVARDDRYKIVLRNDSKGPNELYDLKADAREGVNQFDNPQFLTVKTTRTGELSRWKQKYSV
jgi:arylsulfatase A-like enzyme